MAPPPPPAASAPKPPSRFERWAPTAAAFSRWACRSRLRLIVTATAGLASLIGLFATWSHLARVAVYQREMATLARALFAFDEGRHDDARDTVAHMQQESDAGTFGGALFVLGAIKAAEADETLADDRRRALFLLAARYLQKARELGVPPARSTQLRFLLGKSLVEAQQNEQGIPLLLDIVGERSLPGVEADELLVSAYLGSAEPDLAAAERHLARILGDAALTPAQRDAAHLTRIQVLVQQGRLDEAAALARATPAASPATIRLLEGRVLLHRAADAGDGSSARESALSEAEQAFRQVAQLDAGGGAPSRESLYWLGRLGELRGDWLRAAEHYERCKTLHAGSPEGLAAEFRLARIELQDNRPAAALDGFRTVLRSVEDARTYVNPLLPLAELRQQLRQAHEELLRAGQYDAASSLIAVTETLFSHAEQKGLVAVTHQRWGEALLAGSGLDPYGDSPAAREGRQQLRAAGRAYEDLARTHYATRGFTDDLWLAAENYFGGQSYSSAARVLEEYLRNEVRRLNPLALLRLGQCRLAGNNPRLALEALQECIVTYPRDPAVFRARLESARAYRQARDFAAAEAQLQTNLTGDVLTPESVEWRDSLFELGELLYDAQRYPDAIVRLQEAIARYPQAPQALFAQYTIARAHQALADAPAAAPEAGKTESERQKDRALVQAALQTALDGYLAVERTIALEGNNADRLERALLRNCSMLRGAALYQLRRWEEARQAFGNVSTNYQNDPFVLESYVQIANCWRRLDQPVKARQTIMQALKIMDRIPANVDFQVATNFSRQDWLYVLDQMSQW